MEERNEGDQPRHYVWPRYVLGGLLFWLVLIVIWVSVLVHRTREQRDFMQWPANSPTVSTSAPAPAPIRPPVSTSNAVPTAPTSATNSPTPQTNSATPQAAVDPVRAQRMAEFSDTLTGGNAEAGRKVFFELPAASCGKCHKAGGQGGENGPVLDGIATRQSREFILESILFPNAVINTNWQTVVVVLNNGTSASGTLKIETETNLVLNTPEDGPVPINKADIQRRWIGASPMPEGIWQQISKQDLRDVIEFVASLKP